MCESSENKLNLSLNLIIASVLTWREGRAVVFKPWIVNENFLDKFSFLNSYTLKFDIGKLTTERDKGHMFDTTSLHNRPVVAGAVL